MWQLSVPWWEFVLRALVVYVFLMVLLRITGRRQVGQLSPFDLVLLLVLSNGLQNAMNAGDNSITAGIILSVTLVGVNWIVGWVAWRSKGFSNVIEGRPEVLIHNGKIYRDVMERERLSQADLDMALRRSGCSSVEEVHFAVLETNGQVSVRLRDRHRDGQRDGEHDGEQGDKPGPG